MENCKVSYGENSSIIKQELKNNPFKRINSECEVNVNFLTDKEKELLNEIVSEECNNQMKYLLKGKGIKQQIEEATIFHYSFLTMGKFNEWLNNISPIDINDKNKTNE